jgi:hypothetical protein
MRLAPVAAAFAALALLVASYPVEAQERARTRITVQKRSYLDPGTVVKPGSMRYHDYAFPVESRFPSYGPYAAGDGGYGGSRWPLLRVFEGF